MPTSGEARPDPKARTLARGERKYRRKIASAKQWQAIVAEKSGPCRGCVAPSGNGHGGGRLIEFHHLVSRGHGGDDVAENIVPLHGSCHREITERSELGAIVAENMLRSLTDAEYAYMTQRGGEGYAERAYGVRYER